MPCWAWSLPKSSTGGFPRPTKAISRRLRSRLVSAGPLAQIGAGIGIGDVLRLGSGELRTGGFRRESILADATEALFGAVYLDGGLNEARDLVLRLYRRHAGGAATG